MADKKKPTGYTDEEWEVEKNYPKTEIGPGIKIPKSRAEFLNEAIKKNPKYIPPHFKEGGVTTEGQVPFSSKDPDFLDRKEAWKKEMKNLGITREDLSKPTQKKSPVNEQMRQEHRKDYYKEQRDRLYKRKPEATYEEQLEAIKAEEALKYGTRDEQKSLEANAVSTSINQGKELNEARSQDAINLARETTLPVDYVEQNYDEIKKENDRLGEFDVIDWIDTSPSYAKWIADHPTHASAARQRIGEMSTLERMARGVKQAWFQGIDNVDLAYLQTPLWTQEKLSDEDQKKVDEIIERQSSHVNYSQDLSYFAKIPEDIVEQAPIMIEQARGAAIGVAGAAVVSLPALTGGPYAYGLTFGSTATVAAQTGSILKAMHSEGTLMLGELHRMRDDDGKPLPRDLVVGGAAVVGLVNGALEGLSATMIFKKTGLMKGLSRSGLKALLKDKNFRRTLMRIGKDIGSSGLWEGGTEYAQEWVGILMKQFVESAGNKELEELGWGGFFEKVWTEENKAQANEAFLKASRAGGGMAFVGQAAGAKNTYKQIKQAKEHKQYLEDLSENTKKAKEKGATDEEIETVIKDGSEGGPIEYVYMSPKEWDKYWNKVGKDPEAVAKEVLGDTDAYNEAKESESDIEIPIEKYTSRLAGSDHSAFFQSEVRVGDRNNPNLREAVEYQERAIAEDKRVSEIAEMPAEVEDKDIVGNKFKSEESASEFLVTKERATSAISKLNKQMESYAAVRKEIKDAGLAPDKKLEAQITSATEAITNINAVYNNLSEVKNATKELSPIHDEVVNQMVAADMGVDASINIANMHLQFLNNASKELKKDGINWSPTKIHNLFGLSISRMTADEFKIQVETMRNMEGFAPESDIITKVYNDDGSRVYEKRHIDELAVLIASGEHIRGRAKVDAEGNKVGDIPSQSTFPEFFKNKGYRKKEALAAIKRYKDGKKSLTPIQAAMLEDLYDGYIDMLMNQGVPSAYFQHIPVSNFSYIASIDLVEREFKRLRKETPAGKEVKMNSQKLLSILSKELRNEEIKWLNIPELFEDKKYLSEYYIKSWLTAHTPKIVQMGYNPKDPVSSEHTFEKLEWKNETFNLLGGFVTHKSINEKTGYYTEGSFVNGFRNYDQNGKLLENKKYKTKHRALQGMRDIFIAEGIVHDPDTTKRPRYKSYELSGKTITNHRTITFQLRDREDETSNDLKRIGDFQSKHFSVNGKNILAHARVSEAIDSQGRVTFLIDEIQSDWHIKLGKHKASKKEINFIEEQKNLIKKKTELSRSLVESDYDLELLKKNFKDRKSKHDKEMITLDREINQTYGLPVMDDSLYILESASSYDSETKTYHNFPGFHGLKVKASTTDFIKFNTPVVPGPEEIETMKNNAMSSLVDEYGDPTYIMEAIEDFVDIYTNEIGGREISAQEQKLIFTRIINSYPKYGFMPDFITKNWITFNQYGPRNQMYYKEPKSMLYLSGYNFGQTDPIFFVSNSMSTSIAKFNNFMREYNEDRLGSEHRPPIPNSIIKKHKDAVSNFEKDAKETSNDIEKFNEHMNNLKDDLEVVLVALDNHVADAPFRKHWHEFVMKMLITMASQNDRFKTISITDGYTQWERYGFRKTREGKDKQGNPIKGQKEFFEKMYDSLLPKFFTKLTGQKMFPEKIEAETRAPYTKKEKNPEGKLPESHVSVYSFDISDKMREISRGRGWPLFQNQEDPLAGISFPSNFGSGVQNALLGIFENANASSMIHELGHYYFEVMGVLGQMPKAESIRKRNQKMYAWLSDQPIPVKGKKGKHKVAVNSKNDILDGHHELMARAHELYLREGVAPSIELRDEFYAFSSWLMGVYKHADDLDVNINDDVRSFFDSLIATEEEIELAQMQQNDIPLLDSNVLTEKQREEYEPAIKAQKQAGFEELLAKKRAAINAENQRKYKFIKKELTESITREVNEERVYNVLANMQRGKQADGTDLPSGVQRFKLNKDQLIDLYGKDYLKTLPRPHIYTPKDGYVIDQVADFYGYSSGDQMMKEIVAAEKKQDKIERLVNEKLDQVFGDQHSEEVVAEQAMDAVHSEKKSKRIALEMKYLSEAVWKKSAKKVSLRPMTIKFVRKRAEEIISKKRVRSIRPIDYLRAERTAASKAMDAVLRKDLEEAFRQKDIELLNNELYRAAKLAKERVEKSLKYVNKFKSKNVRKRLGKSGAAYLDNIIVLLDRFGFPRIPTNPDFVKLVSLESIIASEEEIGGTIQLAGWILNESNRKDYQEMTMEELQDVISAIRGVDHLSINSDKLLTAEKKEAFDEVVDEMISSIAASHKIKKLEFKEVKNLLDTLVDGVVSLETIHTKLEFMFEYLDQEKLGPVWRNFYKPIEDAETLKAKYTEESIKELDRIFGIYDKKEIKNLHNKIHIEGVGAFTRAKLLTLALNMGNEYNRDAVMLGNGYTETQINEMLDLLTEKDLQVVKDIWAHFETYWPAMEKLELEMTGIRPKRVQKTPLKTKFGTLDGGYYPVLFRAERNLMGFGSLKHDEAGNVKDMFSGKTWHIKTKTDHLKQRIGTGGRPISMELSGVSDHINDVIHDLTHRKAVYDIHRLLKDKRLALAIAGVVGEQNYKEIMPWLKNIAGDGEKTPTHILERMINSARGAATVAILGAKFSTMILQTSGIFQSIKELGPVAFAKKFKEFAFNPRKMENAWAFMQEKSVMMRNRPKTFDRDIKAFMKNKALMKKSGMIGLPPHIASSFFLGIAWLDMAVSAPTWATAYDKAINGNVDGIKMGDEKKAIYYADQSVRRSQGTGLEKDLARAQRGTSTFRMFTMFYQYGNILYNQLKSIGQQYILTHNHAEFIAHLLLTVAAPSIYEMIISGRWPDEDDLEDDETVAGEVTKKVLMYPTQSVLIFRDIFQGINYKYSPPAALDVLSKGTQAAKSITELKDEDKELSRAEYENLFKTFGYFYKLPSHQVWQSGEYFYDWYSGDIQPESTVGGVWKGLYRGKTKEDE